VSQPFEHERQNMDPITILAVGSVVYAAASELIGMNPKLKANSVVQAAMALAAVFFGRKHKRDIK